MGPRLGGGDAVGGGFSGRGKGGGGSFPDSGLNTISSGEDTAASRTVAAGRSGRGSSREVRDVGGRGFDAGGGEDTRAIEGERGSSDKATAAEKDKGVHGHKCQRCEKQSNFSRKSLEYLATTPSGHYPKLSTTFSPDNRRAVSTSSKAKYSSPVLKPSHSSSSAKRRLDLQYEDDGDVLQDSRSRAHSEMPYHHQFHDIFVCSHDLGIPLGTLAYYAANNRKFDLEIPAGYFRGEQFLSPTDGARVVIARSAGVLEQLHEYDRSLAGLYDFTNFVVYRKKRVKLSDIKPGSIERLKKSNSDEDYSTFALQLHKHFFIINLPSELKGWFRLLLEDPTSHEHLIAHSISLMESAHAIYYFIYIYGELKALEQNCSSDYCDVVRYLNKRHGDWKTQAKLNRFAKEVLEYRNPETGQVVVYGDDADELLKLCRNLITHILGKLLSRQLCLRHKHFLAIINSVFPGLLFDFQVAMSRTGARLSELW